MQVFDKAKEVDGEVEDVDADDVSVQFFHVQIGLA